MSYTNKERFFTSLLWKIPNSVFLLIISPFKVGSEERFCELYIVTTFQYILFSEAYFVSKVYIVAVTVYRMQFCFAISQAVSTTLIFDVYKLYFEKLKLIRLALRHWGIYYNFLLDKFKDLSCGNFT